MKYASLGDTGYRVSRIGLGLAALGRPGYINLGHGEDLDYHYSVETMEQRTHDMLDLAFSEGIRYFDAAQSYGRAENFLSTWLSSRKYKPNDLVVGSKWGYTYTADWKVDAEVHEVKSHTRKILDKQWPESYERLGSYLKLYQIHSATFESGVLENTDVLNRLAEIKDSGIKVGLSLSGANQAAVLERAQNIEIEGKRLFDCVQATWNLLEPSVGPQLAIAAESGMGVIVKEVLANGRLTDKNSDPGFINQKKLLKMHAAKAGVSIDGWAIAAALAKSWAHIVLSGAAKKDHLLSNIHALTIDRENFDTQWELSLTEDAQQYWNNRKSLTWN